MSTQDTQNIKKKRGRPRKNDIQNSNIQQQQNTPQNIPFPSPPLTQPNSSNTSNTSTKIPAKEFKKLQLEHTRKLNELANKYGYSDYTTLHSKLSKQVAEFIAPLTSINYESAQNFGLSELLDKLNSSTDQSYLSGTYNPKLGQQWHDTTFSQPRNMSVEEVEQCLNNPFQNYKQLRSVAELVRNTTLQYKRVEDYFSTMLSFKTRYAYKGNDIDDISEKEYGLLENQLRNFLDRLNLRYNFSQITAKTVEEGSSFYLIKRTVINKDSNETYISFVPLPVDYCYITGFNSTYGYLFGLELTFFTRLIDMQMMTPEIYDSYKELIEQYKSQNNTNNKIYIPIRPQDGFVVMADLARPHRQPLLSALLPDAIYIKSYKELVKKQAILQTWVVIPQVIPLNEDGKPQVSYIDAELAIEKTQATLPPGAKTFTTPLKVEDAVLLQNGNGLTNMLGIGNSNFWNSAGVSASLFGSEVKNASQLFYSTKTDYLFMRHIYWQLMNVTNLLLEMEFKGVKWMVQLFGNAYEEKEERETAIKTLTTCNSPISLVAADIIGSEGNSWDYDIFLKMDMKSKIKERCIPLQSMFQSGSKGDAGAPKSNNPSDATENANSAEANENRGL